MSQADSSNGSFPLGQIVVTHNALASLSQADMTAGLRRHAAGDWGDVCEEDWHFNQQALKRGSRLISVYHAEDGTTFWIITEADRSSTCVLLAEDY